MLMFLFKLGISFFFLTLLSIGAVWVFSQFIEEGIIDSKHEGTIAKYNVYALCTFGGLTLITALFWLFGVIWYI